MKVKGSTARQNVLVVANPTAGSGRGARLEQILEHLEARGCKATLYRTRARGDAERFVRSADCQPFDAIVAAGGDGTINEVLNGLPLNGPPLAILPLGTANVLAKEIGLPCSIDAIADTIAFGPSRPISIGEANGRRFAVMASVGLDATVVERVDLDLKRRVGKWAYLYETAKQIISSDASSYRFDIGNGEQEAQGVIIANGKHYAGRYVAAPKADLEKPSLEICRMTRSGCVATSGYLMSLALGRLAERGDYHVSAATAVDILGPPGAPLQADGDVLCHLPATINVLPAAVDLIFPRATPDPDSSHFQEKPAS